MIESGYPDFISDTFNALFAPAGTPQEVMAILVREAQAAMKDSFAHEQSLKAGFQVVAGSPEQMTARLKREIPEVKELVAKAGIKTE